MFLLPIIGKYLLEGIMVTKMKVKLNLFQAGNTWTSGKEF